MHSFENTGAAYDATQCNPSIRDGEILVIESEQVIGLAWTWPVAVTVTSGNLHSISDISIVADTGWTDAQIVAACAKATELGYELCPHFKGYINAPN